MTGGRFDMKARDHLHVPERKKTYNERHFTVAAPRYDVATRAMSLWRDAAWKRLLVSALPEGRSPVCVDIACGTGDVSFLLAERYPRGDVVGLDLTEPMLAIARKRNRHGNVRFVRHDMGAMPFPDESVDIVTGSYALRNAPDLGGALDEVRRILKPGGAAAFLDFARPASPVLRTLQYRLLRSWCGFWGFALHRNFEIHSYIAASLAAFPDRDRFRDMLRERGFERTRSRRFFFGITEMIVLSRRSPAGTGR
jgi:demethylmenaquinone methyltransferase/2-methoxy-6-polyprenyl-1,4-benzoquinol methylase